MARLKVASKRSSRRARTRFGDVASLSALEGLRMHLATIRKHLADKAETGPWRAPTDSTTAIHLAAIDRDASWLAQVAAQIASNARQAIGDPRPIVLQPRNVRLRVES